MESLEGFAGRLGKDRVFGRYFYEIEGCLLTSRSTIIMRNAPPRRRLCRSHCQRKEDVGVEQLPWWANSSLFGFMLLVKLAVSIE